MIDARDAAVDALASLIHWARNRDAGSPEEPYLSRHSATAVDAILAARERPDQGREPTLSPEWLTRVAQLERERDDLRQRLASESGFADACEHRKRVEELEAEVARLKAAFESATLCTRCGWKYDATGACSNKPCQGGRGEWCLEHHGAPFSTPQAPSPAGPGVAEVERLQRLYDAMPPTPATGPCTRCRGAGFVCNAGVHGKSGGCEMPACDFNRRPCPECGKTSGEPESGNAPLSPVSNPGVDQGLAAEQVPYATTPARGPEEAGPARASVWRVGRKLGRTLYDGDEFRGLLETRELALVVADALNGDAAAERRGMVAGLRWARDWALDKGAHLSAKAFRDETNRLEREAQKEPKR